MSEAPKRIWADWSEDFQATSCSANDFGNGDTAYIRADLVDKLIGYAVHPWWCTDHPSRERGGPCTCGLSDLIKEVRA